MHGLRVTALELRDFRNYHRARLTLDPSLTVIVGPNGAGKTNLLEAICFAATGHSPRTSADRDLVRRGAEVSRVVLDFTGPDDSDHRIEVGSQPGTARSIKLDGATLPSLTELRDRPLVAVFLPERLDLVKGAPSRRRAHLDQLVAALWPGRSDTRAAYGRALAQRNALLARLPHWQFGKAVRSLDSWDAELARHAVDLVAYRTAAVELLAGPLAARAVALGLSEPLTAFYRSRSAAQTPEEFATELLERRRADCERGFTVHGPHRDDLRLDLGPLTLRTYGSQGQQRASLLALLLAERDVLLDARGQAPLLLLDDVMSELDAERRKALVAILREGGQALITTTELEHVPGAADGATVVEARAGDIDPLSGPRSVAV